jgi:hypothetical protein
MPRQCAAYAIAREAVTPIDAPARATDRHATLARA